MLIIETKEQLKKAKKENQEEFIVIGELAKKLYKTRKISKLSKKVAIGLSIAFGVGAAATPFTGGTSAGVSSAIMATSTTAIGGPGVVITAMSIGGVLLLFALFKDYNIDFEVNPAGSVRVKCTKK
ncbi:hypothetical protein CAT7_11325 [Carnobacterium sp. AT7]|uniref:hypothetical protein n=1 Tax=Carnobacterium sp. AT7 TaxID=333990 RepID=UPI00015F2E73|nr:hypothetical protein [Carnobacterium sp. AT7]EDP68168.1 hypothetical protein CAT7_11325 [Carnobacterium sp. AT7]